ncbi:hypothetical protein [Roseisolibacter sp. H3M3-2]|uniref:hypothetical protein n=1 Tax=Roseisolibacter sp. H3M3-2 TaxID=3031323 RepID=UPI0023DB0AF9|nr:hypothetical protein [Roseisolibacter sp. H3M3-2]MDF1502690.1 hypothetical protein [Roseisolibacter sp. H3M3-2]
MVENSSRVPRALTRGYLGLRTATLDSLPFGARDSLARFAVLSPVPALYHERAAKLCRVLTERRSVLEEDPKLYGLLPGDRLALLAVADGEYRFAWESPPACKYDFAPQEQRLRVVNPDALVRTEKVLRRLLDEALVGIPWAQVVERVREAREQRVKRRRDFQKDVAEALQRGS